MKRNFDGSRRRFLDRLPAAASLLLLGGCDRLSESRRFPELLGSAEQANRRLHHLLSHRAAMAREFPEADISPEFPSNGTRQPQDADYQHLLADGFRDWRLGVTGLVEQPLEFSLEALRALPARTQITRHDCVEGWSAIAKWSGARLAPLLEQVRPLPAARYLVFHCFDTMDASGARYYESIDLEDAFHPQTILAYEWNDRPLPVQYGAPLRLRVERQLGYKMPKYLRRIELVERFDGIGGGKGGYWEDLGYEWYGGI